MAKPLDPDLLPTPEELRAMLSYCPETGVLTWISTNFKGRKAGAARGKPGKKRLSIGLRGHIVATSRVIWAMQTGEWPDAQIDHENRDGLDDRWANLRKATQHQNAYNRPITTRNSTGFKGVSIESKTGKYKASIRALGKLHNLGRFDRAEEAHAAYAAAAKELHGDFACLG